MAHEPFALVLHYLRTHLAPVDADEATDGQLLTRFIRCGEVAPFEVLLRRHGPLVWRVCRRVLSSEHDAEDAFQATFLVLVRKAASIRRRASVASWLYGVAHRNAVRARANAQRLRGSDLLDVAGSANVVSEASGREVQAILEEELAQLPEHLRAPLLLCCLEGRSRTEAARQLGWREGTVASRLARARQRLRVRLANRGVTLSVGAVAGLLASDAPAAVPLTVTVAAVRAAGLYALGDAAAGPALSTPVTTLAKAALQAMLVTKLKVGAALALVCGILAAGAGLAVQRALEGKAPAAVQGGGPKLEAEHAGSPKPDAVRQARTDYYGDSLPAGAVARFGTVRFRHEGEANSLVFSPDGKVLAGRCDNGMIVFWEVRTGRELQRIRGVAGSLPLDRLIDFSPDGRILAAPSDAKEIAFWDTATGKPQRKVTLPEAVVHALGGTDINTILFSPDGKFLAVRGSNNSYVLDVAAGKPLHHFKEIIGGLTFSPDGTSLILQVLPMPPGTRELQVRSLRTGQILHRQELPSPDLICAITLSPDGKMIATSGTDEINLWDAATVALRSRIQAKMGQVKNLAFTPDGKALVAGSEADGKVHVWDPATGKEQRQLDSRMGILRSMALSTDGKTVAAGTVHNTIRLWDLATGQERFTEYQGHDSQVNSITYSPDGKLLASGGENGQIWIWDTATGKPIRALRGTSARLVAFSPDNRCLAVLSPGKKYYSGKFIHIFDVSSGKELHRLPPEEAHSVHCLAFSPDGKTLVSADWKSQGRGGVMGGLNVWELQTGRRLRRFPLEGLRPEAIAFGPDGRTVLVAGCSDGQSIRLWDLRRGEETLAFRSGQLVTSIALAPDGRTLVSGGADHTVRLWEVATGNLIFAFEGHTGEVTSVAFSPDGRLIAWAGVPSRDTGAVRESASIRLGEVLTGEELRRLEGHSSTVTCLAFSPDGSRLASGLRNSTVLLWEVSPTPRSPRQEKAQWGPKELETLWSDLAGEDARKAYRAIYTLVAAPAQAVPFLAAQLRPATEVDRERVQQLIADLDSDRFARRAGAAKELAELGDRVEPALREALQGKASAEVRQRAETLLAAARAAPPPTTLRTLRAIQVLERIGTREAQQILRKLSAGPVAARETRDAKEAVERLASARE